MKTLNEEVSRISELFHEKGSHIMLQPDIREFMDKVRSENPDMESRFASIVKNKGLDAARQAYQKYDPVAIKNLGKQERRRESSLSRQLAKIEKEGNLQAQHNELIQVVQFLIKNASIMNHVIEFCQSKPTLQKFLRGKQYRNLFNNTVQTRISDLDWAFKDRHRLPLEKMLLSDMPLKFKKEDWYDGEDEESIFIMSYLDFENIDTEPLVFDIRFQLDEMGLYTRLDSYSKGINANINNKLSAQHISTIELMDRLNQAAEWLTPEHKEYIKNKIQSQLNEEVSRIHTLATGNKLLICENNSIDDFRLQKLKNFVQQAINNGSISPEDITPYRYFIAGIGYMGNLISLSSSLYKDGCRDIIEQMKNTEAVERIFMEKPTVGFMTFSRLESGQWSSRGMNIRNDQVILPKINEDISRIQTLIELRNNEVKVRMRQGVAFRDVTMPLSSNQSVFTGNETGVVISGTNNFGDEVQVQLDDGRVILTSDDAVADTSVGQDIGSIETNDMNDSGMNNSLGSAGGV